MLLSLARGLPLARAPAALETGRAQTLAHPPDAGESPGVEPDEVVLSLAVQRGLLSTAQAAQARAAAAAQRVPLRSLLARAVPPQALADLVAQASASSSSSATPGTPSRGVPTAGPTRFDAAPGTTRLAPGGDERGRLVDGLRALRRQDPRFAPHAELVFEVVARLGEGGMGVVERVRDARLGREAALKRMRSGGEAPEVVARFWREAEVTARLDHPSIPPVYEAGTDAAGRPYLLMRVIEGESLADAIGRSHAGPPPSLAELRHLLEALLKVAEAVAYAHSRGVIHRDLKPANIMVGRFGEVLVMDWGLARIGPAAEAAKDDDALRRSLPSAEEAPLGATIAGSTMGTPGYMPPEQASGEVVDARADVFALGAILVELLTGRPPVDGSTPLNRIAATVQGRIATPRSRRPELPGDLDGIAARALRADPLARTPDAATFVEEVRSLLAGVDVPGHRYGLGERLRRLARRRPGLLVGGLAAAVSVNVFVALALSVRSAERERAAANRTRDSVQAALDLLAQAEELSQRGRTAEVEERIERALAAMTTTDRPPPRAMRLAAAQAYEAAGLEQKASEQLNASRGEHPPGTRELLLLHRLFLRHDARAARMHSGALDLLLTVAEEGDDPAEEDLRRYARGRRLVDQGQHARARVELEAALAANPGLVPAATELGEVLQQLGDAEAELALYAKMLDRPLHPRERALLLAQRAQLRLLRGEVDQAEVDAALALGAFPDLVTALFVKARVLIQRGRTAEAEACIRAMKDSPLAARTWAVLYARTGQPERVLEWTEKALATDPADLESRLLRAQTKAFARDWAGARAEIEQALERQPRFAMGLVLRSQLKLGAGDAAGAEADARAAREAFPSHHLPWTALANALRARGDEEGARAAYEEAAKRNGGTVGPREVEARLEEAYRRGDREALAAEIDRALRDDAECVLALILRAQLAGERGDLRAALADADRAIALAPGRALAYDVRGGARLQLGDLPQARADFDKAIELGSRNLRTLTTRATLRYNEGDLDGALADVETALAKDPRCADGYYVRAGVKQRKGDASGCREDLERFLELAPAGDPRAQQLRQKLGKP